MRGACLGRHHSIAAASEYGWLGDEYAGYTDAYAE